MVKVFKITIAGAAGHGCAVANGSGAGGERFHRRRRSRWIWHRSDPRWRACAARGLRGSATAAPAAGLLRARGIRAAAMDTRLVRLLRSALSRLRPANGIFRRPGRGALFLPLTVDRSMQSVRPSETRSLNHPALDHRGSRLTREDIEGPSNEHFEATDLSPIAEKFRLGRDTLLGISRQKGRPILQTLQSGLFGKAGNPVARSYREGNGEARGSKPEEG